MDKQQVIGDLIEINAYRTLAGRPFDFGTGLIVDASIYSEDAYWKMEEQDLLEYLNPLPKQEIKRKKVRSNKYYRKYLGRKRMRKLAKEECYFVYNKGFDYKWYLSGRRKLAKWCTNRKIRNGNKEFKLKCGGYRKVFDYWWTIF